MMNHDTDIDSRYSRQLLFTPIGEAGQRRLTKSRVAVVGMGALGSVLANHMVRAGVGYVRLIDRDFVEPSNLQRQMLYEEQDAAESKPKALAAAERLVRINSLVTVEPKVTDLNWSNAEALLSDVDLILDGTDNFSVRFLINDVSIKHDIPWIYGGAVSSRGITMTIIPGETPCLRCLFGQAPAPGTTETCDTAGVIGAIIHVIASFQAAEALKLLVGDKEHLSRSMSQFDLWFNQTSSVDVSKAKRPGCPCCDLRKFEYLQADLEGETIQSLCGRSSVQIVPVHKRAYDLSEWSEKLGKIQDTRVERNPFLLKLHLPGDYTLILFPDGRVMIQGTEDPLLAKSLYSRYIGN